jgi:NADPH:quinone reductase-like Zn-dependent oxidoreductase
MLMKAVVYTEYGPPDVLQLKEAEKLSPKDNEALVKVHAASLNAGDWHLLRGELPPRLVTGGLLKPKHKILGDDIAGQVEAIGRNVKQFQPGQRVLITGASGGIGTFAVQIAKSFGAEVTGVCSTRKLDMVRSIGADQVIDYTQEDYTKSGQRYDLILDVAAYRSIFDCRRALSPEGIYVCIRRFHGSIFPSYAPGTIDFNDGE